MMKQIETARLDITGKVLNLRMMLHEYHLRQLDPTPLTPEGVRAFYAELASFKEGTYYPQLRKLQDRCGALGHLYKPWYPEGYMDDIWNEEYACTVCGHHAKANEYGELYTENPEYDPEVEEVA